MCGLTAVYYADSCSPPSKDGLVDMLNASLGSIYYRGPDAQGTYVSADGRVGLGHCRLSIIDLETGDQPLSDEENLIHCVVTGEIYDYERIRAHLESKGSVFKTKSDSEVVIHLYKHNGLNLLSSLRGEFAFVLYDAKKRIVMAARDRFGVKPLSYTISDGRLLLASEIKAFPALGWKPEWDAASIVNNGYFTDDRTVFKGVRKLMPGTYLVFHLDGYLKVQPYWDLEYADQNTTITETVDDMIVNLRTRLQEAVRLRLRADVPVGLYLSGGIDSAAVGGIATELLREKNPAAKLTTFTLSFPYAGPKFDEGPIAARTAAFIGAESHMVSLTVSQLVDALDETVWHCESPLVSLHAPGKFLLSKFAREKGYKVVLTGEGSDEFFGGYAWLTVDYLRAADPAGRALKLDLPSEAERAGILKHIQTHLSSVPTLWMSPNSSTDAQLARNMLGGISTHRAFVAAGMPTAEPYSTALRSVTGDPDCTGVLAEGVDPRVREKAVSGQWHPFHVASYVTGKTFLPAAILLQIGERTEMAHSIESRPAFLDHNLVEYVNSLPPSVKVHPNKGQGPGGWTFTDKWILRQAVKPFVTEEVFERRKVPYNPPVVPNQDDQSDARQSPLPMMLKARITEANVNKLGLFDWNFVSGVLEQYLTAPEFPPDGGVDGRAQLLMYVLSFIILQERFDVPTWVGGGF
ncbi:putative asparagine synthase [Roridomyces roridus]|uniref:Asparagine synthase n=1 Tax=Roridomyces roridus TaxID=1738132 RepID=A0AAD7F868_9AGAR|nr:putative asparagine synthase [Roridomyces roridus]